jgi:hypothetical protein
MRRAKRLSIIFFILGFCSCLFLIGTVRFLKDLSWTGFISKCNEAVVFYPVGHCPDCKKISKRYWKIGPLNDANPVHLECAQRMGIIPFQTNAELESNIDSYVFRGKLKKLEDTDTYKLKKLTHSYPYLVPQAVNLLNEIGQRFEKKLAELDIPPRYMMISSVLRTNESQYGLGQRNSNATTISAHMFGTTFDISYKEFLPLHGVQAREGYCRHDMLRHPLAEVLTEMSEEGRCKVVIEKKQACFHVTVAK